MKKNFSAIIGFILFTSSVAFANITVSPHYISFDAESSKRSEQVRLTNTGKQTQTFRIKLVHYRQQKNGSYKPITEKEDLFSATPYLEFSPRETSLKPHQTQTIRIQRKAMPLATTGEYVAHLMMQEVEAPPFDEKKEAKQGLNIHLTALYGITIPVIIEKGELTNTAVIKTAKWAMQKDTPTATVTVSRDGTRSFYGKVVILENKTQIGRIDNFRIFVGTPERTLIIPLTKKPIGELLVQLWDARSNVLLSTQSL